MIDLEITQYLRRAVSITSNAPLMRLLRNAHFDTNAVVQHRQMMNVLVMDLFFANPHRQVFVFYLDDFFGQGSEFIMPMTAFPFPELLGMLSESPSNEWLSETAVYFDSVGNQFIYFFRNVSYLGGVDCVLAIRISYDRLSGFLNIDNADVIPGMVLTHVQANGEPYNRVFFQHTDDITGFNDTGYTILTSDAIIDGSYFELALPPFYGVTVYLRNLFLWILPIPLFILIAVFISNRTSAMITGSLNSFLSSLNSGNYDELRENFSNEPADTEVEIIKSEFLKTLINVDEAHKQLASANKQKFRMELNLLHERMNPHLLYNSIAVLCVYAQNRMDDETVGILRALSSYYHKVLTDDKDIITLDTELSILSHYLEITNRISVCHYTLAVSKEESMGEMYVLKHMLQPLVENIVKHAYSDDGEGIIHVDCRIEGSSMVFEVSDNGAGMDDQTVAELLALKDNAESGRNDDGYGLRNLIRRLDVFCGDAHDLQIKSIPGEGTIITIIIPAELTI